MIAIVLVAWNHAETTTAPCIRSIRRFTGEPFRLICVDNGCTDPTPELLAWTAAIDPRVVPVRAEENLGWARGTLLGLEHLDEQDDLVCLLNSDTVVTPGWLGRMRALLDADPGLFAVTPWERPEVEAARELDGRAPSWPAVLDVAAEAREHFGGRSEPSPPSGYCLLVRRSGLDVLIEYLSDFERFHSGERSWRDFAEERGVTCRTALDVFVFHARGGSGGYYDYGNDPASSSSSRASTRARADAQSSSGTASPE